MSAHFDPILGTGTKRSRTASVLFTILGAAPTINVINFVANGTFSVTGAANVLSTFGITGAANALSTLGVTGTLTTLGNTSFGLLKANSTVISANGSTGLTGTFVANGTANTVHVTNGIITSVS